MTHTNRLAAETSPYLLQHAHNPVDWHPWGPEAFEIARREDKPIFLSVGYSTCYWCHVMERQCFEVEAIAAEMNKRFINIKVDREERPDVDQLYMNAVQLITRQGGWPMSVFLLPDLRPFYGGTYFPPDDAHGRPGFVRLLGAVEDAYRNRRKEVESSAEQISNLLKQLGQPPAPAKPIRLDMNWVKSMIARSTSDYDPANGGYGSAPKFPRQTLLELVLVFLQDHPSDEMLAHVRHTLDAMAQGGIRDHLGGGFHRYSTDAQWIVPHFEIMLYDNAMLAWVYTEAYRQTEDLRYAAVARGICDFVLREMTSPAGAFYTAFDAEVDAQEGLSYLWTQAEAEQILRDGGVIETEIERFSRIYGLHQGPNFADPHHGNGIPDKNILLLAEPDWRGTPALLDATLIPMRELLYTARRARKQPSLDTKILTSWNALMIRALAFAGDIFQEERYIKAAESAADFILQNHRDVDGGLTRTSRDGPAKYAGFLDDYAFMVQALLALEEAGDNEKRKEQAGALALLMRERFGEQDKGGFYFTQASATDLIVRQKTAADSPLPSGNGVAAMMLVELDQPEIARATIGAFAAQLEQVGEGMSAMVQAAMVYIQRHDPIAVTPGAVEADRPLTPAQIAGEVISISPAWSGLSQLNVHVNILKGYHINAHEAGAGLMATQLSVSGPSAEDMVGIDYPAGQEQSFEFSETPMRVYSGEIRIAVRFSRHQIGQEGLELALRYQACDEKSCLPAVTKVIRVALP